MSYELMTAGTRAVRDTSNFTGRGDGNPVTVCGFRARGAIGLLAACVGTLLLIGAAPVSAVAAEPELGVGIAGSDAGVDSASPSPSMIDGWRADTSRVDDRSANTGAQGDDLRSLLEAAGEAEARGQLDIAQRLFEKVIAIDPGSGEAVSARRRLGAIYRGELAIRAPGSTAERDAGSAVTTAPLPDIETTPQPGSGAAAEDGVRPASLDASALEAGALEAGKGRDAREAALATPVNPPAADVQPAPQPWRAQARPSPRFEQLLRTDVGDRIFFGASSAEIGSRARDVLEHQVEWLARYRDLYVVIEGHSDDPGSESDNDKIALQRAETARKLLVGMGMKADRVDIDVRGRKDPVATCESGGCHAQNRRAVIRLMVVLPARPGDRSSLDDAPFIGYAPR